MVDIEFLNEDDSPVIFALAEAANNKKIAIATLNAPRALNALNLDMIRLLGPQLEAWESDESIAMVMIRGEGDKAFCAGGDVVSLYKAMENGDPEQYVETFFSEEYRLDHTIHTFNKPIVVWGNGIIMGGGLGLMAGASHRIVTENSRIAMPEITIGLYPDVGGSYFLNKMPEGVGLFLGLTGASINATDARQIGLADTFINSNNFMMFLHNLTEVNWDEANVCNFDKLTDLLSSICEAAHHEPDGKIEHLADAFVELSKLDSIDEQVQFILSLDSADNKWLSKAQKGLKQGSPLSAVLISEQLKRHADLSLAECFRKELALSVACGKFGEFQEGVRALLIDKDGKPSWRYDEISKVPSNVIASFFDARWTCESHPLKDL